MKNSKKSTIDDSKDKLPGAIDDQTPNDLTISQKALLTPDSMDSKLNDIACENLLNIDVLRRLPFNEKLTLILTWKKSITRDVNQGNSYEVFTQAIMDDMQREIEEHRFMLRIRNYMSVKEICEATASYGFKRKSVAALQQEINRRGIKPVLPGGKGAKNRAYYDFSEVIKLFERK